MSGSKQERPADFWSKMISSKLLRDKIGLLKYARWAQDVNEEQFTALLCAVGEFGYRADELLEILRRNAPKNDVSIARAIVGLKIMAEFTAGRPSTEEEQTRRIRKAVADAQGSQAEPGTSPNGGPATPSGDSEIAEGPPSVS